MATEARIGHGAEFRVATPEAPTVYTTLGEVTNIQPPPMVRDVIDATHMASPNKWREFIAGLKDGGEVQISLNFIPDSATDVRLRAMQTEDDPSSIKIVFPGGEEWGFTAFCTGYTPTVPHDDKMTADATFKVTGEPDFTDPS
jgi:predicted secreted protein